jgi:hypothetical protein
MAKIVFGEIGQPYPGKVTAIQCDEECLIFCESGHGKANPVKFNDKCFGFFKRQADSTNAVNEIEKDRQKSTQS